MAESAKPTPSTPTLDEIRTWGATTDVVTAGTAFGLGRNKSYDLAARGEFPVPVLKIGVQYRVVVGEILAVLDPASSASSAA
jgi:hypothetical protein